MNKKTLENYMAKKGKLFYSQRNFPKLLASLGINQYIVLDTIRSLSEVKVVDEETDVSTTQIKRLLKKILTYKQIKTALLSLEKNAIITREEKSRNKWFVKTEIFDAVMKLNQVQESFESVFDKKIKLLLRTITTNMNGKKFFQFQNIQFVIDEMNNLDFKNYYIDENHFEFEYVPGKKFCSLHVIFQPSEDEKVIIYIETIATETNLDNFKSIYNRTNYKKKDSKQLLTKWLKSTIDSISLILMENLSDSETKFEIRNS